jgi:hypothetical protein
MQIKIIVKYHFVDIRIAVNRKTSDGENVEERENVYTIGGNISQCSHYGKQHKES